MVIDHSHILLDEGEIDFDIDVTEWPQEELIFGYHSNFYTFMDHNTIGQALKALEKVDKNALEPILNSVPTVWGATQNELENLADCIVLRAELMQDWFEESILGQGILEL